MQGWPLPWCWPMQTFHGPSFWRSTLAIVASGLSFPRKHRVVLGPLFHEIGISGAQVDSDGEVLGVSVGAQVFGLH